MLAHVFLPSRKGKKARLYVGRYRFDDMPTIREVSLNTPDRLTAIKRLNDFIIRRQRQAEGLAVTEPMGKALAGSFAALVTEYGIDLRAEGRTPAHVKDTTRRLIRIASNSGWLTLRDADAASFTRWRGRVASEMAAKTLKEYHVSLSAFFKWLNVTGRFDRNPFSGIRRPVTKGRATRTRRAFTAAEARRLLAVADYHRIPYLVMLYTGMRYREAWGVRWCDFLTDAKGPRFVIPAAKTKNREEAVIPLRAELVTEIEKLRTGRALREPTRRIFIGIFPGLKTTAKKPNALRRDLAAASVPVYDERGHVLDYHSFRKTWTTWAAAAGVPQRAAQAILRHSTPDLTANIYTDTAGLGLDAAVSRLPWVGVPESTPLHDSAESETVHGEARKNIAQTLANLFFAMVDPTGLESIDSLVVDVLRETNAEISRRVSHLIASRRRTHDGNGR